MCIAMVAGNIYCNDTSEYAPFNFAWMTADDLRDDPYCVPVVFDTPEYALEFFAARSLHKDSVQIIPI